MPTGYTAKLMEEGEEFAPFVMRCARAFGALILMRDDPMDAPIPNKFEPSDYHERMLVEAKAQLERLNNMNEIELRNFGGDEKLKALNSLRQAIAKDQAQSKRLKEMEKLVLDWTPPSKDHTGLKEFILDQLRISDPNIKYYEDQIDTLVQKTPEKYWLDSIRVAEHNVTYHTEHARKEVERANERTQWVQQLRDSLK